MSKRPGPNALDSVLALTRGYSASPTGNFYASYIGYLLAHVHVRMLFGDAIMSESDPGLSLSISTKSSSDIQCACVFPLGEKKVFCVLNSEVTRVKSRKRNRKLNVLVGFLLEWVCWL